MQTGALAMGSRMSGGWGRMGGRKGLGTWDLVLRTQRRTGELEKLLLPPLLLPPLLLPPDWLESRGEFT
jgi:hypothetical protein